MNKDRHHQNIVQDNFTKEHFIQLSLVQKHLKM